MSDIVIGEVDWQSGAVGDGGGRTDFMKLEPGSKNRVRVMGNPVQFYSHWLDLPGGKKRKVNCPISDPKLVKKLVDAGFKRQARWFIRVLDRSDSEFKLLEIGSQIYNGIKELHADEDWGPVTAYDITIKRGQPGDQPLYSVTPIPKSPLDSSLKEAFVAFNDRVDVSKFTQPGDPAEIKELLGWTESAGKKATSSADAFGGASDDDDMFNFED